MSTPVCACLNHGLCDVQNMFALTKVDTVRKVPQTFGHQVTYKLCTCTCITYISFCGHWLLTQLPGATCWPLTSLAEKHTNL